MEFPDGELFGEGVPERSPSSDMARPPIVVPVDEDHSEPFSGCVQLPERKQQVEMDARRGS